MTHYEFMYWMLRYGMITVEEWRDYCNTVFDNILADPELEAVFKRLKHV